MDAEQPGLLDHASKHNDKIVNNTNDNHNKTTSNQTTCTSNNCKVHVGYICLILALVATAGYFEFFYNGRSRSRIANSKTSKNKYYAVVDKSLNQFDANKYCSDHYGTSLATIFDMYDNNVVNDLCKWIYESSNGNGNNSSDDSDDELRGGCWIGYTKSDTYKSWPFWIDSDNSSDSDSDWFWLWYNRASDWVLLFNDSDDVNILTNNFENWNGKYQTIEDDTACALLLNRNGTWNSKICADEYHPFVCNYYLKVKSEVKPSYVVYLNVYILHCDHVLWHSKWD